MKNALAALAVAALVVAVGCDNKDKKTGGTGNTEKKGTLTGRPAEDNFDVNPPLTSTTIQQGETKNIDISIKKGKNFDQDVPLMFEDLPKGVTIEPATVKKGEDKVSVKVTAAPDAATNDFKVKVIGKPKEGKPAENTLNLTVKKKG